MSIGTVIPDLDNTLSPEEVRRKTFEEKYATAFNKDQREILDALIGGGGGGGGSVVGWNQKVSEGVNIADISINGETTPVYAPEGGGGEQVQSDWEQVDDTAVDFIKNKPTIPAAQAQADWTQSDSSAADFIKHKPSIPAAQVQADWNVTSSSSKAFIKNKPTIPAHIRVLFSAYSAPPSDLKRALSASSAFQIPGFDNFSYTSQNWQTVTPTKFYLLFTNSYLTDKTLSMVCSRNSSLSSGEVRYTITHQSNTIGYLSLYDNVLELWFTSDGFERFFGSSDMNVTGVNNVLSLSNDDDNQQQLGLCMVRNPGLDDFQSLYNFNRYLAGDGRVGFLVFYEM